MLAKFWRHVVVPLAAKRRGNLARFWQKLRIRLAAREMKSLEHMVSLLPTENETRATESRLEHYALQLADRTSWNVNKRLVEVRLTADEQLYFLRKAMSAARWAMRLDPNVKIDHDVAERLRPALGRHVETVQEAENELREHREWWRMLVGRVRQVRTPLFASQAFFKLSERSGLELASLVVSAMVALGAVQMLFFYQTAADQFVFAYWTWDDLVIQSINAVPIAIVTVVFVELAFRLWRWVAESVGMLRGVLGVLKYPIRAATVIFVLGLVTASGWGHIRGADVWHDFREATLRESATMLDGTILRNIHLVGTTSRAAIFLQELDNKAGQGERSGAAQDGQPNDAPEAEVGPPSYWGVVERAFVALPKPWNADRDGELDHKPGRTAAEEPAEPGTLPRCRHSRPPTTEAAASNEGSGALRRGGCRVLVMDRNMVVCHAKGEACIELLKDRAPNVPHLRARNAVSGLPDNVLEQ